VGKVSADGYDPADVARRASITQRTYERRRSALWQWTPEKAFRARAFDWYMFPAGGPTRAAGRPMKGPGRLVRLATLERCGGNVTRAARQLGIAKGAFWHWLRRLEQNEGTEHLPKRIPYNETASRVLAARKLRTR
jgi:hypothetical protein